MQLAAIGDPDWTKITNGSGIAKVQLGGNTHTTVDGSPWDGQLARGIKFEAGTAEATALIELTGPEEMKVEVFAGETASQINGFTSAAVMYNRGQDAHLVQSTTATN